MSVQRLLLAACLVAMVGYLGYRVVVTATSAGGEEEAAGAVERLRAAPLDGGAFADLAVAAREAGDVDASLALHQLASRRDPRDLRVRAWLGDVHMRSGDYSKALEQLDVMLRLSPEARKALTPLMVQWADDTAFAEALVVKLREAPTWRRDMVSALREGIARPGAGAVFAALSGSGDLGDEEMTRWLDALMDAGNWGLAYSYWASGLQLEKGASLPMLYNGGFETAPSQRGFDWRTDTRSGTYTEFEPTQGANGNAAHLVFHGRPVDAGDLEQALALAPGRYRISMRVKAAALRSDQGLHWVIVCHKQPKPLATGERLDGSFGWREATLEVGIPDSGCPGQWLRLENPAPSGSARIVSGELWIDDVVLRPLGRVAP